jgi:molybdopterin-guanine dinucleotide biosynthesis protein A
MTGIILAGGKNSRISMTKALIKIGQQTIIENTVFLFKHLFEEVIIVTNQLKNYQDFGVILTKDLIPNKGPLGGLYTGLKLSSNLYNFVVACDMPFVNPLIIEYLQNYTTDKNYDVIIPQFKGYVEPLFAFYTKKCLGAFRSNLKQNQLKIKDCFSQLKVKEVPCNKFASVEKFFFNINTKEDLVLAKQLNRG